VKVRFAVSVAGGPPNPELLASVVTEAESIGFDTLWFSDVPSLPATDPLLGVAFTAACTKRMKLGINLIPLGYRPYVIAHKVAQLDRLTGGRLLVTLVPGLETAGERAALGNYGRDRGQMLDALIPELRRWWAGESVSVADDTEPVPLSVRPVQDPLEIWLGGSGPKNLQRVGRLADGWLGSLVSPDQAGPKLAQIQAAAAAAGRTIDPEHFGLSIAYARESDDLGRSAILRRPRAKGDEPVDITELVPIGRSALRSLIGRLVDQGLSKFVVRSLAPVESWPEELSWLADTLLDLQT
jgi:probable F420-dependent oxidoreductase